MARIIAIADFSSSYETGQATIVTLHFKDGAHSRVIGYAASYPDARDEDPQWTGMLAAPGKLYEPTPITAPTYEHLTEIVSEETGGLDVETINSTGFPL